MIAAFVRIQMIDLMGVFAVLVKTPCWNMINLNEFYRSSHNTAVFQWSLYA
jgi:hypothetical protein